jgi:hypothetical protein
MSVLGELHHDSGPTLTPFAWANLTAGTATLSGWVWVRAPLAPAARRGSQRPTLEAVGYNNHIQDILQQMASEASDLAGLDEYIPICRLRQRCVRGQKQALVVHTN